MVINSELVAAILWRPYWILLVVWWSNGTTNLSSRFLVDKNLGIETKKYIYHKYFMTYGNFNEFLKATELYKDFMVAIMDLMAAILDSIGDIAIQWHH